MARGESINAGTAKKPIPRAGVLPPGPPTTAEVRDERLAFDLLARPLLELVQRRTGLETSFVTSIDWDAQAQEVLTAINRSELNVAEGSVVPWSDSMCRLSFLSGKEQTSDVLGDFPGSLGGEELGMRSFFALPILEGATMLGTVCGASRRAVTLELDVLEDIRLIAQAMGVQLRALREAEAQRARAEVAEALALTDVLTGLPNRRAFTGRMEQELARARRHGSQLAVLVMDVDCFKAVNDTHGHHGGDAVLRVLGETLRTVARTEDVPARLGGDEFVLLLPGAGAGGARGAALRVLRKFRTMTVDRGIPGTLSIGASSSDRSPLDSLLVDADSALYRAKTKGRDRVEH